LLLTYAVGTAAPLFCIAWLWDRYDLGRKPWSQGRIVHLGPIAIHTTNLVAGTLFLLLGASFIMSRGSAVLSTVYADLGLEQIGFRAQVWVQDTLGRVPDALWVALSVLGAVGAVLWRRSRRVRKQERLPGE
jgi:hypothetical protein